ncbi:peptide ABC transporter substrate-binding protein [Endozoicomonas sp. SCSIO W0465]|uniref:peptide ABC transporter substrate-binding protein n=1 Tax=Endozoicomonas sp. SCSIO W0465 TaxID=2918516 RepID=UPI0020764949|nr:peptide ABC transporter substrate-binding protein [Endozoicomonas sp. SCSIO W0465]USE36091.1 peptide ABC transporter substrate-binding protein [Endozoicomonas sp. SCSIO W0465]
MSVKFQLSKRLKVGILAVSVALTGMLYTTPDNNALAAGTLRIGNMGEPASLDPHFISGTWESGIVGNLFLGLTTEAADGSIIPGAAESWTVSDDGLVYTFTLRNHKWSDGEPVTAQDFVYSLQRILKPETAAGYASLLYTIKGAEQINTGKSGPETLAVSALNDNTLKITLNGPAPYFIAQLAHYTAYPVPTHKIRELGKDWAKTKGMVSNGAFVLEEWTPNSRIRLVKNTEFYDAGNVSLDELVYYPQEDRSAVLKRVRAGEVDIQTDFASSDLKWLEKNMPDYVRIAPYLGIYYYPLNLNDEVLQDKRVRQALAMTIDRKILTDKVLKSGELPAYSFVPPGTGNYGKPAEVSWKELSQAERIAEARKLLEAAGYSKANPPTLKLSYNTSENHKKVAIAIAAMWKKALGVKTELYNSEVKVHYASLKTRDFQAARAGWIADYNDPQNFLNLMESRNTSQNYSDYNNASFNQLMKQAEMEADSVKRNDFMRQAELIAMDELPNIPIFYYVSKNLVNPKVKGWIDNPSDIHRARYLSITE